MISKRNVVILLVLFTLSLLAGCQQAKTIEGAERDAIVAQAEPIADTIIAGLGDGDYAVFAEHLDSAMTEAMTEQAFNDLSGQINQKLGTYESRDVTTVQEVEEYNAVVYDLQFSNAPSVTMRLVLTRTDPPQVTGLWFDSPELRAQ